MSALTGHLAYSFTVFVGGIPGSIENSCIENYFSRYGRVVQVIAPTKACNASVKKGYCFVVFDSADSCNQVVAIGDHYLGSRRVSCKHYLKGSSLHYQVSDMSVKKLFVKFVPSWLSEEEFRAYFEQFGEIESYYTVKYCDTFNAQNSSSVGYLVFKDPEISESITSIRFFKIGNKKMQVEKFYKNFSTSKELEKLEVNAKALPPNNGQSRPLTDKVRHHIKPTASLYNRNTIWRGSCDQPQHSSNLTKTSGSRYRFNRDSQGRVKPPAVISLPTEHIVSRAISCL